MSQAFWIDESGTALVVVGDDGSYQFAYPLKAGDPDSLGDHVSQSLRDAARKAHPYAAWRAYLAALVPPTPPAPLTPAEKLAAAGLSVDELKGLLGLQQEAS